MTLPGKSPEEKWQDLVHSARREVPPAIDLRSRVRERLATGSWADGQSDPDPLTLIVRFFEGKRGRFLFTGGFAAILALLAVAFLAGEGTLIQMPSDISGNVDATNTSDPLYQYLQSGDWENLLQSPGTS